MVYGRMALCVKCKTTPNTGEGDLCGPCFAAAMVIYDSYHLVPKVGTAAWQPVVLELVGRIRFEVAIGLLEEGRQTTEWRGSPRRNAKHQQRMDILLQRLAKLRAKSPDSFDPNDPAYALGVEYGLL